MPVTLRAGDIDAIGRAHLEHYCRTTAKIVLIDRWIDEHGLIRPDGTLQPAMKYYVALTNSARASLKALEDHLRDRDIDPFEALRAHLKAKAQP